MSPVEVIALVAGILLLLAAIMVPIRRRAKRLKASIEAEYGGAARRIANAQGLGLESRGAAQIRGNGWLVLTDDELQFRQWVPDRTTRVPLAAVTDVGTVRVWLGKTVGSKLLCVRWREPDGSEDAMAWNVRGLDEWLEAFGTRGS